MNAPWLSYPVARQVIELARKLTIERKLPAETARNKSVATSWNDQDIREVVQ